MYLSDTAPNKRRLSLSYLLDQSDPPPLKRTNDVQLAPITMLNESRILNTAATFQGTIPSLVDLDVVRVTHSIN